MDKFIIGTIGRVYEPLILSQKGEKAVSNYICNVTYEDTQREKDEILNTTLDEMKEYTNMIKEGMKENYCTVVGNESKIKENSSIFNKIEKLI